MVQERTSKTAPVAVLMSENQVADATGGAIPARRLQQLRQRGGGPPFVKIGRLVRYEWADVRAWLDVQKRVSTSDAGEAA